MKKSIFLIPPLVAYFCGLTMAEAIRTAPLSTDASLPVPIVADLPADPPAPIEKPDFQIESTQVKLIEVVEPPPMPGLPSVEGTITLRVHSVADPGLPDPPRPQPASLSEDPEFQSRFLEADWEYQPTSTAFISATVYDRSRTLLTCHLGGVAEHAVTAWSNLDFNHFSGVVEFTVRETDGTQRHYHLLMGIGNDDSMEQEISAIEPDAPRRPALPDGAPAFVVVSDAPSPAVLKFLEDLHALYRNEGARMVEEAAARQQAYEAKKAHYLANPPKPKDITIHFWNRQ